MKPTGQAPASAASPLPGAPAALREAGWDPLWPGPECVQLLSSLSAKVGHLEQRSATGVLWRMLALALFQRFGGGAAWRENGQALLRLAAVFLLARQQRRHYLTCSELHSLEADLVAWCEAVLAPSQRRMEQALKESGERYVLEHSAEFEPHFTLATLQVEANLVDVEGDCVRMAKGVAMHEQGRLEPLPPPPPLSMEDLLGWHEFVTRGGESVAFIGADGRIRVHPLRVKTLLDRLLQRQPGVPFGEQPLLEAAAPDPVDTREATSICADELEVVRALIAQRLAQAKPGTAAWHVLVNLELLAAEESTLAELAEKTGLTRRSLELARQKELEALRARLNA